MRIIKEGIHNGRKVVVGIGTYEEVESLNKVKDFETALNLLATIRKTRRTFFNQKNESNEVDRKIMGKRRKSK
ncbi:MAG: hypothetical protein A2474_05745 [Elusimicrobia bacterium RIFOXYC2_FULL_34_12]|nr:MAG: hypothetical protein A2474_05745 [Elusimicrobia bacterium RIFOXYC2_FULL_34_12]OGS38763.1 MAG: hypothetical protein A2551_01005 [Elusimicrobia bacterium RIFOXYD2_FULL_34_30]HAM38954.1 hypothetical protein [Elusimicrobiota bacterium]